MDHPPALRIKGMSTQARRCCGASISMAGRRARISLSRSNAASSNTRNLFERNERDALQGDVDLARQFDLRRLPRVEVAWKGQPFVARDEAQLGLPVGARANGRGADVAESGAFDLELGKERNAGAAAFRPRFLFRRPEGRRSTIQRRKVSFDT